MQGDRATIYTLHKPHCTVLSWVKEKMIILGPPVIRIAYRYENTFALEGTHRIVAAYELDYPVIIHPIEGNMTNHDLVGMPKVVPIDRIIGEYDKAKRYGLPSYTVSITEG